MITIDSTVLSTEQRLQFEKDGYFFPIRVLTDDEVKHYLDHYLDYHQQHRERIEKMQVKDR